MAKNVELRELAQDPSAQHHFYESSKQWVLSLKERHDPYNLIEILDDDVERYPFEAIEKILLLSYQPSWQEVMQEGKIAIQNRILGTVREGANEVMGEGYFDSFVDDLLASRNIPQHPETVLKTIWGRLAVPRHNVAQVAYHPNIMALPIYSGGVATAFSRSNFLRGQFDLFEFSQQNLMLVNPALSIASFRGNPVMELLNEFGTVIKAMPPTRSSLRFYKDKASRHAIIESTKDSMVAYLDGLEAQNKSAILTIDPTASTSELIIKDGALSAIRRGPVSPAARELILKDFAFAWPMTMVFNGGPPKWHIGALNSLRLPRYFDEVIDGLNFQTEELAGVKIMVEHAERQIGKTALMQPSV